MSFGFSVGNLVAVQLVLQKAASKVLNLQTLDASAFKTLEPLRSHLNSLGPFLQQLLDFGRDYGVIDSEESERSHVVKKAEETCQALESTLTDLIQLIESLQPEEAERPIPSRRRARWRFSLVEHRFKAMTERLITQENALEYLIQAYV